MTHYGPKPPPPPPEPPTTGPSLADVFDHEGWERTPADGYRATMNPAMVSTFENRLLVAGWRVVKAVIDFLT